jgi:hypothetical protein
MTRSPSVLRNALTLLSVRLVLEQIGLALLVFLLYVLWLKVPDASVLDVIGSAVLAIIVLAVAGGGESALVLRLAGRARTPGRLLRGALFLVAGVALWFAWSALLDHLHGDDSLRAGYWNSRFPHQLRNLFSYAHILLWLGWAWTTLAWIGAGVIALFVFAGTASARPVRAIVAAARSVTYWITVVLGTIVATVSIGSLLQWTPGHGLRVELISVAIRLSLAALIDVVLVCFLMAILAARVRQSDALYATPAGTPDESQPRTVDNP